MPKYVTIIGGFERKVSCLLETIRVTARQISVLLQARHILRTGLMSALLFSAPMAGAQDTRILPDNIIFVTSTGFWEDSKLDDAQPPAVAQRGYYKLVAVRQPEGNAHIHLQQVAAGNGGPSIVSSTELEEFSAMKVYVTDIRPETSDGIAQEPGLFATVYLKTDPQATTSESWSVLIDDVGDIRIERETN